MGQWHTLHLFDDKRFYTDTVPLLKGQQGDIQAYYIMYEQTCTKGICDIPLAELVAVFNQLKGYRLDYLPFMEVIHKEWYPFLSTLPWTYHLSAFFEYVVFSHCADYAPYFRLGKHAALHRMPGINSNGLSYEILGELSMIYPGIFTVEGMGVTGWITSEEVKELLAGLKNEETINDIEDFIAFLEVSASLDMGIIAGVDLREDALRKLPSFKFSKRDMWDLQLIERLAIE
ncbi:hypothetical protein [[Flexibacter] sp. ATCC 35208]|uniref:hypothetical protein n=1 Tax=[Flexibacter] sp. ATCC 35208 TaxID=1936242 RepID=UPI0009CAF4E0|nr:hypothetical protein [[Flexibacter] sp. ATCC 35208]OMP80022.1 hypothetical protein BW716_05885 [[Flexibacter] sp. ATCC 35208]